MVFHVLNRGVGRRLLFTKDEDFLAFERVVEETLRTRRMRLCAYCLRICVVSGSAWCQTLFLVSKIARKNQEQSLTPSLRSFKKKSRTANPIGFFLSSPPKVRS